jgi:hypothetical protein
VPLRHLGFIELPMHAKHGGFDDAAAIDRIPTAPGARTALFVPELSRLYVAVPHRGSQAAEIRGYAVSP